MSGSRTARQSHQVVILEIYVAVALEGSRLEPLCAKTENSSSCSYLVVFMWAGPQFMFGGTRYLTNPRGPESLLHKVGTRTTQVTHRLNSTELSKLTVLNIGASFGSGS